MEEVWGGLGAAAGQRKQPWRYSQKGLVHARAGRNSRAAARHQALILPASPPSPVAHRSPLPSDHPLYILRVPSHPARDGNTLVSLPTLGHHPQSSVLGLDTLHQSSGHSGVSLTVQQRRYAMARPGGCRDTKSRGPAHFGSVAQRFQPVGIMVCVGGWIAASPDQWRSVRMR